MALNLSALSLAELNDHLAAVNAAIEVRKISDKSQAKQTLEAQAAARGFSIEELFALGGRRRAVARGGSGAARGMVAPKYAHPDTPSLTWSGRGRAPKWFVVAEASGIGRTQMEITKS